MNDTKTLTISEFLKERYAEAEEAAKLAGNHVLFVCSHGHIEQPIVDDDPWEGTGEYERWADGQYRLPNHHNSWHPLLDTTHLLEDIMSKRAIVDLHKQHPFEHGICDTCPELYPCTTLRLLAAPYRRHEDYQEAWA